MSTYSSPLAFAGFDDSYNDSMTSELQDSTFRASLTGRSDDDVSGFTFSPSSEAAGSFDILSPGTRQYLDSLDLPASSPPVAQTARSAPSPTSPLAASSPTTMSPEVPERSSNASTPQTQLFNSPLPATVSMRRSRTMPKTTLLKRAVLKNVDLNTLPGDQTASSPLKSLTTAARFATSSAPAPKASMSKSLVRVRPSRATPERGIEVNRSFLKPVLPIASPQTVPRQQTQKPGRSSPSKSVFRVKQPAELKPNYANLLMSSRAKLAAEEAAADALAASQHPEHEDWQDLEPEYSEDSPYKSFDQSYDNSYNDSVASSSLIETPTYRSSKSQRRRAREPTPQPSRAEPEPTQVQASRHVLLDPQMPYILSGYLQLCFNLTMMALLVYCVYIFISTVGHDVDQKVEEYSADILAEISMCSKEYMRNNCLPDRRAPALEKMCNSWDKCMNQDPALVGRARVSAETFGEIINSFLSPIGLKSMIFMVSAFVGSFIVVNFVFSYGPRPRARSSRSQRSSKSSMSPGTPSPTPQGPRGAQQVPVQQYLMYPAQTPLHAGVPHTPGYFWTGEQRVRSTSKRRAPLFASTRRRK